MGVAEVGMTDANANRPEGAGPAGNGTGKPASGGALLTAYGWGGRLALPLLAGIYAWRVRRGKEELARRDERFGRTAHRRPEGPLVWVHAASVGETNAVLPLIEWIAGRGMTVLLTTGTVTSANVAAERLPRGAIHQYFPFDVMPAIDRFLDHWRPTAAIAVESEIWPATLSRLSRRGIPTVIVNGRMSESSFHGWRRLGSAAACVFGALDLCLAQSGGDAERFQRLGVADVRVAGNLKFDVPMLSVDAGQLSGLGAVIGERPVWFAASTHEGEEEIIARLHAMLRETFPDLLLVCAPRHPHRGRAVADIFAQAGHDVSQRSLGHAIRKATAVYVADTMGEMGLFYRLAQVAFVGGSLVPKGGHNPIEPAQLGCAIVCGPSTRNSIKIYELLSAAGGAHVAGSEEELGRTLTQLIGDPQARATMAAAARGAVADGQGALTRVIAALDPIFAPTAPGNGTPATNAGSRGKDRAGDRT